MFALLVWVGAWVALLVLALLSHAMVVPAVAHRDHRAGAGEPVTS